MIGEEDSLDATEPCKPWVRTDKAGEMKMENLRAVASQDLPHPQDRSKPRSPGILDHINADVGKLKVGSHRGWRFFEKAQHTLPSALA